MVYRKNRRFRHRSNGRSRAGHRNGVEQIRLGPNSFSNNRTRNNFKTPYNVEKLVEKYNTLAKEALFTGDRTLSENYLQHADHFTRIMVEKNLIQNQNKVEIIKREESPDDNSAKKDTPSQKKEPQENNN